MYAIEMLTNTVDANEIHTVCFLITCPTWMAIDLQAVGAQLHRAHTSVPELVETTAVPLAWTAEMGGDIAEPDVALEAWLDARDAACDSVERMLAAGVATEVAHRLLSPFDHVVVNLETTDLPALTFHFTGDEQPVEFQWLGVEMRRLVWESKA